jgi:hypothetical protein
MEGPVQVVETPAVERTFPLAGTDPQAAELALLRRFEPVVRYTKGERFFPFEVERYLCECSLWVQRGDRPPECLVPEGQLTPEKLAESRTVGPSSVLYLKFIDPLNIADFAAYKMQRTLKHLRDPKSDDFFHPGRGRLARVGYFSRFVDALFTISLLARGRVPGDTAVAAGLAYRRLLAADERYPYYGRVVRANGWTALQYWFFYPFNNWRSGFYGANDHEADWEMIYVYVSPDDEGELHPRWVAYASHDFSGDDLRRRWDDPELEKVGEHPVIYCGAGSHASYFARGEYLPEVELPFLAPAIRLVDRLQRFWWNTLRQAGARVGRPPTFNFLRVPFVDYARGDGRCIGPGQDREWTPALLDPLPVWASDYRGLWGLYARDPVAGENAPAGPVYNRDGAVRRSWYDPLGWAGLEKVPPPTEIEATVRRRRAQLEARLMELDHLITEKSGDLTALGVETAAAEGQPHLEQARQAQRENIQALADELNSLRAERAAADALFDALEGYAARARAGDLGPPRGHIRRAHHPVDDSDTHTNVVAEIWAALSIGLMMVGFVVLYFTTPGRYWPIGLAALLAVIVFVEAGFRRRLMRLTTSLTVALAVFSALVLIYEFFWEIVIVTVLLAGGYIIWNNWRELRN